MMITIGHMVRPSTPPPEKMRLRTLASLGESPVGPLHLARAESGRYNGRLLSIQRLYPHIEAAEPLRTTVLDEVWLSALIASRNVAQFVTWGSDEDGTFLAFELLQGVPLLVLRRAAAARREIINDRLLGFIVSEICAGLWAMQSVAGADGKSLNLRHEHLYSGSVVITFRGEVKIADFGFQRARQRIHEALGEPGSQPSAYQPPANPPFEGNADLYAWGVVISELLTGRSPVSTSTAAQRSTGQYRASEPPHNTGTMRRFVDPFFVDIARACIEQKAGDRPKSAFDILELFADWRAVRGFGEGDPENLARWTQSLGSAVLAWFRRAAAGEFLRLSGAPKLTDVYVQTEAARVSDSGRSAEPRESRRPSSVFPPPQPSAAQSRSTSAPAFSGVAEKKSETAPPLMSGPRGAGAGAGAPAPFSRPQPDDRRPPPLSASPPPPAPSNPGAPSLPSIPVPPVSSRFTFVSRWAVGNTEDSTESPDLSRTRAHRNTGATPTAQPPPSSPRLPAPPPVPAQSSIAPAENEGGDAAPATLRTGSSMHTHNENRSSSTPD